jgi:large subunit ribosomal protein L32
MAVPRNRTSNARKGNRRSHHAKTPVNATKCSGCGTLKMSHTVCPSCGRYSGRVVTEQKEG